MIDDPRASYWNNSYQTYWRERVSEANGTGASEVLKGDAKSEGDWVYEKVFDAHSFKPGTVLDVGCAWGRMFPLYIARDLSVSGIDISESMVEAARETWSDHSNVATIETAVAEDLPFDDESFDNLVCVAVFDATFQHQALESFLRVLKPGGRIYLTGKSNRYCPDDTLALAAEEGARAKGHPNFFTDVESMLAALRFTGCEILASYYFERRGDFANFNAKTEKPEAFYEWFVVLTLSDKVTRHNPILQPFAFDHSLTFLNFANDAGK